MVGQEKLVAKLKSYPIETFPQTILLIGDSGCGKHTLAQDIASRFNIDIIDMTKNISLDYINDVYARALPLFYLIDMSQVNDKQQNVILKFLEEPVKGSHIILLCENKASLLDTIINRCVVFEFKPYTKKELEQFLQSEEQRELVLSVCETPGQVSSLNVKMLDGLNSLCDGIVNKLSNAIYQNALTIPSKFNYKDEYDKYDLNVFFKLLASKLEQEYINNNSIECVDMYNILVEYKKMLRDTRLNKELLMENMITKLWLKVRKC